MENNFGESIAAFVAMSETRQIVPPKELNITNINRKGAAPHRKIGLPLNTLFFFNRRDGVVVRASALQSVDLGFIPLVESYQETLKNGIRSFPAWRSAFRGGCGEQAGKFACCVLGQGT